MSISKKSKINLFILVVNILFMCSVFADSYYTVKKGDTLYSIATKNNSGAQAMRSFIACAEQASFGGKHTCSMPIACGISYM